MSLKPFGYSRASFAVVLLFLLSTGAFAGIKLSLEIADVEGGDGVLVTKVMSGFGKELGLEKNDLIVKINDRRITETGDILKELSLSQKTYTVYWKRGGVWYKNTVSNSSHGGNKDAERKKDEEKPYRVVHKEPLKSDKPFSD